MATSSPTLTTTASFLPGLSRTLHLPAHCTSPAVTRSSPRQATGRTRRQCGRNRLRSVAGKRPGHVGWHSTGVVGQLLRTGSGGLLPFVQLDWLADGRVLDGSTSPAPVRADVGCLHRQHLARHHPRRLQPQRHRRRGRLHSSAGHAWPNRCRPGGRRQWQRNDRRGDYDGLENHSAIMPAAVQAPVPPCPNRRACCCFSLGTLAICSSRRPKAS